MRVIHRQFDYNPQPKQELMHDCPANEVLFGGSAGPGKSYSLRYEALLWANRIPGLQVYLFRRTYPEIERNHILQILSDWGDKYGKWSGTKKRYELPNGSKIHACHAQYDKDVMLYHGAEIHLLIIDELTTFSEWQYTYLRNRVRCTLPIAPEYRHRIPGVVCGSNPGGVGHEFCKRLFVDYCRIGHGAASRLKAGGLPVYEHTSHATGESISYSLRRAPKSDGGMMRAYIPALLEDNQMLMERDPGYIDRVRAMPEPYRSAYLDGDWDLFVGQMFSFSKRVHVCKPFPVPDHAPLYSTFDWGFGKPFSAGWWFCDSENRVFRFAELYGWNGTPDTGLRDSDSQIAEKIIEREKELGLRNAEGNWVWPSEIVRLCDPTCFNRKPDYKGGGQGESTADMFIKFGLILQPGDPNRILKIRQFHERLRKPDNGDMPMMMIFDTCHQFIRTIPLLQQDLHKPEDVDTNMEDHVYDESCHVLMARPISAQLPKKPKTAIELRIEELQNRSKDDRDENYYIEQYHNSFFAEDMEDTYYNDL